MSLLVFQHVRRGFADSAAPGGRREILNDIHLELAPGEVVALTGRSGAGKTTLLYLGCGLCRPSGGRILFAGDDLAGLDEAARARLRRRRIGLVFQNNLCLSALPVWENVGLPLILEGAAPRAARREADAMLGRVGLGGRGDASTAALSGGQRRRLGLARALVGEPELLLADEPTADLDEATGVSIRELIFRDLRARGAAALIVTHDPAIEQAADRVLRLTDGRIAEG